MGRRMPTSASLDPEDFARRRADADAGRECTSVSLPGSPWDRWVLVALHRHLQRQQLVVDVVRDRLGVAPEALGTQGSFAHPRGRAHGPVSGLPGWRYRFHGRGCCLTRADGTTLDVDFKADGSTAVSSWFYARYLASVPQPAWLEQRLRDDGDLRGWQASLEPLRELELLEAKCIRVASHVSPWCEAVSQALDHANADALRGIALALEDYPLALQLGGSSHAYAAAAAKQLEHRSREFGDRLVNRAGTRSNECLLALAAIDPKAARRIALAQLRSGPIDAVLSACMRLVAEHPEPSDAPDVSALLDRLTGNQPPVPHLRTAGVRHLLAEHRRGTVPDELRERLLAVLADDQRANEGNAALLVYLLDEERGLARMRAGLRSEVPMARSDCSAALGLVGTPDALDILRHEATDEAAAVLALLRGEDPQPGPEPRGAIIELMGEPRRVYTVSELLVAEFEPLVFAAATRFWTEHESLLRRFEAH